MSASTATGGTTHPIRLLERTGVELEYMIVDAATLDVRPITDEVIRAVAGAYESEIEPDEPGGGIAWSNELVLHVIELKTAGPVADLDPLPARFDAHVRRIEALLAPHGARLLPTAMHPWMDPHRECRLWPHEHNPVYETFDRIFSCRGHGWANLQSTHVNLSFGDDEEFGRLHAAVRLVLPLLPALAASSPVHDGALAASADARLEVYRTNARRVPSVCGRVIPEPVYTRAAYEQDLLGGIYRDLAPLDPEGILRHEWVNARGAIARFDRGSIEIRVLDIQECPRADVAIVALVVAVVRALVDERRTDAAALREIGVEPLAAVLDATIREAERAVVDCPPLLCALGLGAAPRTAGEAWRALLETVLPAHPLFTPTLAAMIEAGSLSSRIRRRLGAAPDRRRLRATWTELADCLRHGRLFDAG